MSAGEVTVPTVRATFEAEPHLARRPAVHVGCGLGHLPAMIRSSVERTEEETTVATTGDDRTAELKAAISNRLLEMLVPGAVVIWRTPDFIFEHAFGTRDRTWRGPGKEVTLDDHFRVGSNTKTMTGTIVLQLVADPNVDLWLDDPVSKHIEISNYQETGRITIQHLLEMRSGLYNYSDSLSFNQRLDDDPVTPLDIDNLIRDGVNGHSTGIPGQEFHYSNTNTALLGKIIERYDSKPLWRSFEDRIFKPLSMATTYLPRGADRALPSHHPCGYMYGTNVSTIDTMALSPADQERAYNGTLAPGDYTELTPTWMWAAGAVVSTATDLATYVRVLVRGGLLPDDLQRRRLESITTTDPQDRASAGYGLAIAKFGPMIGHDGTLPGYQSFMGHDPKTDSTLVIATNLSAGPDGKLTANEIAMVILGRP
jgi:D-alanyl-D-alanine carboxypeptidase